MRWKSQRFAYREALTYIKGRHNKTVGSFVTPWDKVNNAGVDGLEWHSLTIIAARPASGKTCIKDQIVREAHLHNDHNRMRVLEFQFEMLARASKVREFSSVLSKPYKYVCSAGGTSLTGNDYQTLVNYSENMTNLETVPVDIIEEPLTVKEIRAEIEEYMKQNQEDVYKDGEKKGKRYINTVVTIDHSYLVKTEDNETKMDMLYNLGEMCTQLKRKYPIAFIVLSQLNRNIEAPERNREGTYGNYINDGDILGADGLLQHADMVIGVNRPALKSIKYYGPEKYIIEDDSVLVFHFLKCRMGDTRMSFFRAEFDKMKVSEMDTPQTKQ